MGEAIRVDLASDTATRPTRRMRRIMADAEVGDEQKGEDPTVNRLCERVAELLGKEAAVFLPSGIMCNAIAVLVHCRPGDEILAAQNSHVITSEGGGASALAGALLTTIPAPHGIFTDEALVACLRLRRPRAPSPRLVILEQTHNRGGGSVWPGPTIVAVAEAAHRHGLLVHLDGARLMNAVVASGTSAVQFATPCDTAWLGLTKGLGCPVGAVLAGTRDFIKEAWLWKHRLGGAMRQAGVLAAAALYALDTHVERLAMDHENAREFAKRIGRISGIAVRPDIIETNLVFFDVDRTGKTAHEIVAQLMPRGVRLGIESDFRLRAVTHLGINKAAVAYAATSLAEVIAA